jgi:hypothetical protein
MMTGKVRRIRWVAPHEYEYTSYSGEKRKDWKDWIEVETFDSATIMQLDNRRGPGDGFMLRVPMTDPETGGDTDADGDTSLLRIIMIGATMEIHGGFAVKGFISLQELEHEKAYRNTDLNGCLDANTLYELGTQYIVEEWQLTR